jgi:DnaJ-class molecular chaperone
LSPDEVRRGYKQLVTKWHPDKWGTGTAEEQVAAAERFKVVQGAYETLRAAGLAA